MPDSATRQADVIVVGGGVIGLATAWELQRRGRDVLVLEKDGPGAGASQAAGGMLGPIAEAQIEEPELITIGLDSLRRYPAFVAELEKASGRSCGYRTEGTILVAVNRDHQAEQEHLAETFRQRDLKATLITAEQVLEMEPNVSHRVLSGLYIQDDLRVDPRALVDCLVESFRSAGGRLETGRTVREIRASHGKIDAVVTDDGTEYRAGQVLAAAGAWTWRDVKMPVPDPGLRPVKGQLLRLRGEELLRHVVRSPDIYLIPQTGGELLVGATMEEQGFDLAPTAGAALDLLRFGWQVLPGIYELEFVEMSVGPRPAVDDHLPVLGPTEIEGLHLAVAHFRKGILLAPATATYLADWMLSGERPGAMEPFGADRLATEPKP